MLGNTLSTVPPRNFLVCVNPLNCILCWQGLLQGLCLPYVLLPELQRNKYTSQVCGARRGGHRTPSSTTVASLDCTFIKTSLCCSKNLRGPFRLSCYIHGVGWPWFAWAASDFNAGRMGASYEQLNWFQFELASTGLSHLAHSHLPSAILAFAS